MSIGIHCQIEICTTLEDDESFSDVDLIRSLSTGEIFIWHVPSIFHAIGLGHYKTSFPNPLIPLRGIPPTLSRSIVEKECVLVSPATQKDVRGRKDCNFMIDVVDEATFAEWESELAGTTATIYPIAEPNRYFDAIQKGERLIFDPGCQFPSWLTRDEIIQAAEHCNVSISLDHDDRHVAHFATVLDWMKSLEQVYGQQNVRLIFWFDSVI